MMRFWSRKFLYKRDIFLSIYRKRSRIPLNYRSLQLFSTEREQNGKKSEKFNYTVSEKKLIEDISVPSSTITKKNNSNDGIYNLFSSIGDRRSSNLLHSLSKEKGQRWIALNGFPKFTHRFDLLLALKEFQPLKIDPILDRVLLLPVGKYALLFPDYVSSEQFADFIESSSSLLQTQFQVSRTINANRFTTMERERIDDRTVWMSNVDPHIYEKHLYYWLENYQLQEGKSIIRRKELTTGNLFLIKFVHPDEAIRFVIDKQSAILNERKINLVHYNA